jgi:translation initiation factor IF-2
MSETKETADKTLRGGERKPLSLKRTVESGHVRQSFSHGRSKSVVVEKKKTRKLSTPGEAEDGKVLETVEVGAQEPAEIVALQKTGGLSTDELDARRRALEAEKERAEAAEQERVRLEALRPKVEPKPETAPETVITKPEVVKPEAPKPAAEAQAEPRTPEKGKTAEALRRPPEVARRTGRAAELEPEVEDDARGKKKGAKPVKESGQGRR